MREIIPFGKTVSDANRTAQDAYGMAQSSIAQLDALAGEEVESSDTDAQLRAAQFSQIRMAVSMSMQLQQASLTDDQAMAVSTLWPEWSSESVQYKADDIVRYGTQLYRCAQDHTSSENNNPTVASLWTKITIDPETGYDVWQQPSGAHDAYNIGDRVLYPDADGQVYESTINGNAWSPEAYPAGWKLIEE